MEWIEAKDVDAKYFLSLFGFAVLGIIIAFVLLYLFVVITSFLAVQSQCDFLLLKYGGQQLSAETVSLCVNAPRTLLLYAVGTVTAFIVLGYFFRKGLKGFRERYYPKKLTETKKKKIGKKAKSTAPSPIEGIMWRQFIHDNKNWLIAGLLGVIVLLYLLAYLPSTIPEPDAVEQPKTQLINCEECPQPSCPTCPTCPTVSCPPCTQGVSGTLSPPYVVMAGREAKVVFRKKDGSLLTWIFSANSFESNIYMGTLMRNLSVEQLNLIAPEVADRFSAGSKYIKAGDWQVVDFRPYVEARNFGTVIPDLYADYETDKEFIEEVFNIVKQVTVYSEEIKDTPRLPVETMVEGGGDCEDTAILVASMLKAVPKDWKVQFVYMDSDNPLEPEELNHVLVFVDTGEYSTFIETTSKTVMSLHPKIVGYYVDA